ncbi:Uncharacterized conserved protein, DUF697 family [Pseudobutyrivibrio sp. OR37]|uniref:hypothetical protein n=1 Tax=Pseudobutyrivibrio sp. OR37 TaxID=1798186 RepID=UPI0008F4223A|nr:hypothetical protein [Pseudobutyrivibrio sp. OR37]SFI25546.1 Uncharacterized conserved protein, DUF697 family [Pseudobutyrivibrio sp. OR37]
MEGSDLEIKKLVLSKRLRAQSIIGIATTVGVVVGAIPIPFSDAVLLNKAENIEVNSIATIYEITKDDKSREFINTIIQVGTASSVISSAASALKAIPGVNLGTGVINAIIAGSIVAVIGESAVFAFEQVSMGKKTIDDLEWLEKVMKSKFAARFTKSVYASFRQISNNAKKEEILQIIKENFFTTTSVAAR